MVIIERFLAGKGFILRVKRDTFLRAEALLFNNPGITVVGSVARECCTVQYTHREAQGGYVHPVYTPGVHREAYTRIHPPGRHIPGYTHQGGYSLLLLPPREAILSSFTTPGRHIPALTTPREAYSRFKHTQGGYTLVIPPREAIPSLYHPGRHITHQGASHGYKTE